MSTPLQYRQWLQTKANDTTPENSWDANSAGMLLQIVGDDGKLDANAVKENRVITGSDGNRYKVAGTEGNLATPSRGLMDVNDALIERYNKYTKNQDLIDQYNQENQGYVKGGSGGGSDTTIDPTVLNGILGEIAGLDTSLGQARQANQTSYQSTLDNYNADAVNQEAKKNESLNTNDLAYLADQQKSLVNSAKLRQSLLSTLIGMGALNGSGIGQANSTIGGALQNDLTGANSNYSTNANNVLSAMDKYNTANEARKKSAEDTLKYANIAADNSFAVNKQDYLKQLAGLYPTGSVQGSEFLKQAMALGPQILANSNVPQFDRTPITSASFNAPELAKYLSGTNQLSVGGQDPNASVGSFYTTNKKRTDLTAPLALTTGV